MSLLAEMTVADGLALGEIASSMAGKFVVLGAVVVVVGRGGGEGFRMNSMVVRGRSEQVVSWWWYSSSGSEWSEKMRGEGSSPLCLEGARVVGRSSR